MRADTLEKCLELIEASFLLTGKEFPQPVHKLYATCLHPLDDALGLQVVASLVQSSQWPPKPCHITEAYADRIAATPDPDLAWAEVDYLIEQYGVNGRRTSSIGPTGREHVLYKAGAPTFSHPLIGQVIDSLCGWEDLCSGALSYQEGGHIGQFKSAYGRARTKYRQSVIDAISSGITQSLAVTAYVAWVKPVSGQRGATAAIPDDAQYAGQQRIPMPASTRAAVQRLISKGDGHA